MSHRYDSAALPPETDTPPAAPPPGQATYRIKVDAHWTTAISTFLLFVATALLAWATFVLTDIERGRDDAETKRSISLALSRLQEVMDTHGGTRPCTRYILRHGLLPQMIESLPVVALPRLESEDEQAERDACLAGLYERTSTPPVATQWEYMRDQIWPFVNALDVVASNISQRNAAESIASDDDLKAQTDTSGQAFLRKQVRDILEDETVCFLTKYVDYMNERRRQAGTAEKKYAHEWAVFRVMRQAESNCIEKLPLLTTASAR